MNASSPDPRFYKDGHGFRPRWRLFFVNPRHYMWLVQPHWLLVWRIRRCDNRKSESR